MEKYYTVEKDVGETPLQAIEKHRNLRKISPDTPLAYAGRLDPMASGKLLVLVGEECKKQNSYHGLDKEYKVEVLFGMHSDSGDVLGLVSEVERKLISLAELKAKMQELVGTVTFPYPIFSSKTVNGKPLHTWTVEHRLNEIEIPTYTAPIHKMNLLNVSSKTRKEIFNEVSKKIETIPPVTDIRKALGNDFRRPDIRKVWSEFVKAGSTDDVFSVATISCIVGSGVYMRTVADELAKKVGTRGLAYSIHRTKIGSYVPMFKSFGWWRKNF